jgi:hypothetical protein
MLPALAIATAPFGDCAKPEVLALVLRFCVSPLVSPILIAALALICPEDVEPALHAEDAD